jgi:preprotein translocase subunit SecF
VFEILKDTNYDFMGKRKFWMALSAVLMVLSAAVIYVRGINWGIEFKGGS